MISGGDEALAEGSEARATRGTLAPTSGPLCVAGEMTLSRAVALRDSLMAGLAQPATRVDLDLSEVSELDTAGVQLLLFAKRAALAQGKELHLVGQSSAVLRVLELLHLDSYFGGPEFVLFGLESEP